MVPLVTASLREHRVGMGVPCHHNNRNRRFNNGRNRRTFKSTAVDNFLRNFKGAIESLPASARYEGRTKFTRFQQIIRQSDTQP